MTELLDSPLETDQFLVFKRVLVSLLCVVVAFCGYELVSTFLGAKDTGILIVRSSKPNTLLSVSKDNSEAKVIGTGNAKVRLAPGIYHLVGLSGGARANLTVRVSKNSVIRSYIKPAYPPSAPSVNSINFKGVDAFLNSGLTTAQINNLKQSIFQFKPTAHTVSITNITPAPHDPNTSTSFAINFKVSVDSVPYNATVDYTGLDNIRLHLYDAQNGNPLFDSGDITPGGNNKLTQRDNISALGEVANHGVGVGGGYESLVERQVVG